MTPLPPFGTFPKIHPFWWGKASLRPVWKFLQVQLSLLGARVYEPKTGDVCILGANISNILSANISNIVGANISNIVGANISNILGANISRLDRFAALDLSLTFLCDSSPSVQTAPG